MSRRRTTVNTPYGTESPMKKNKNDEYLEDDEEGGPTSRPTERKFLGKRSSNVSIEVEENRGDLVRPQQIGDENITPIGNRQISNTSSMGDKSAEVPNETVLVQVQHKRAASAVPISFKY